MLAGLVFLGGGAHAGGRWRPSGIIPWDWQLTGPLDLKRDVAMIDLDLFETDVDIVVRLKSRGIRTVCYLSAGSWEDWREDAGEFPREVLGKDYSDWPGERWLDIRRIDLLTPVIRARLDLCRDKGFDGIEPDNIDGFTNDTGFPLTPEDQLRYNRWLASEAHRRGLSIGLKNDSEQAPQLVADFDWALTEDCFAQGWCDRMLPFIQMGKAVFAVEYTDRDMTTGKFCAKAASLGISAILKTRKLDAWWKPCP